MGLQDVPMTLPLKRLEGKGNTCIIDPFSGRVIRVLLALCDMLNSWSQEKGDKRGHEMGVANETTFFGSHSRRSQPDGLTCGKSLECYCDSHTLERACRSNFIFASWAGRCQADP